MKRLSILLPLLLALPTLLAAQMPLGGGYSPLVNRSVDLGSIISTGHDHDKCGPIEEWEKAAYQRIVASGNGHYYDDLLADITEWQQSPYVVDVRSIGTTVQERDIWELTITSPEEGREMRKRVTIHARTHPHEIQSWWVAEAVIEFLLSDDPYAEILRRSIVFHIYPMYNPDGVELNSTRYNANGIDLEREWDKAQPQPEAAALKARFDEFMKSSQPIEVALNLHSSSDPERYFWFHDANGTSEEFAGLQRNYIDVVRRFHSKIMPWNYRVSWKSAAPTHFPESWFWHNHGASVMALTYEEVFSHNLSTPGADFDIAGEALLRGIGGYLGFGATSVGTEATMPAWLDLK